MEKIILYKYSGDSRKVDKNLSDGLELTGNFADVDTRTPSLLISCSINLLTYNYCYIPSLKRYYFIDTIVVRGNNKYYLRFTCDVLYTYKNEILASTGLIVRGGNNTFLSTRQSVYDMRGKMLTINYPLAPLDDKGNLVMVTIKGL